MPIDSFLFDISCAVQTLRALNVPIVLRRSAKILVFRVTEFCSHLVVLKSVFVSGKTGDDRG